MMPGYEDLVPGRIYQVRCRNLKYAAYDGRGGFRGIRTKFGRRFLDTEMHWDDDGCGTVRSAFDTGFSVPGYCSISHCASPAFGGALMAVLLAIEAMDEALILAGGEDKPTREEP